MVIKLFYHSHKCADIFVDYLVLSDGGWVGAKNCEWVGAKNGETVCRFDNSQYDVIETDYGFEVNKVV